LLVAAFGVMPTLIIAATTLAGQPRDAEHASEFLRSAGMLWAGLALFYAVSCLYWYSGPVCSFDRHKGEFRIERGRNLLRRVPLDRIRWVYLESRLQGAGTRWYRVVLVLRGEEELRLSRRWSNGSEGFEALEREIRGLIGPAAPPPRREASTPSRPRRCWFCGGRARSRFGLGLLLSKPPRETVSRKIPRCARCGTIQEWHERSGPILAVVAAAALTFIPYFRLVSGQPTPRLALLLFFPFGLAFFGASAGGILGVRFLLDPGRFAARTVEDWENYELVVRMRRRGWTVGLAPRATGIDTS
jgi:hypothetical protein